MKRLAIAIGPSYVSKAGKKTDHFGRFWLGCASAIKHGLEILGIAVIDADIKDAMMLRAIQTLNTTELGDKNFIKRFFDLIGIDPYKTLNPKLVKELFGLATDAA